MPPTTFPDEPSKRFPCLVDFQLLRAPDQVLTTDVTCIPLCKGFFYLVAVVELFSRPVLSWMLSNSLDAEFRQGKALIGLLVDQPPQALQKSA